MKTLIFTLLLIPITVWADLNIDNVWVKNAPPVVPVRAAYLTLINNSNQTEIIESITSPQFKSVEPHETTLSNGVYSMSPLENLTIKGNSRLVLKPNGKHLMLMMPTSSLMSLKHIQINFHLANGKVIHINAPIKNSL